MTELKKKLFQAYYFLFHRITARHTKGYGVHSPFLFHFVRFVLMENWPFYSFGLIEQRRSELLKSKMIIDKRDFGTSKSRMVKVSSIAAKSLSSAKTGKMLFRIINTYHYKNVLELGTSLGITTAYMASVGKELNCVTLEGCPETASIAQTTFRQLGLDNIKTVTGDITHTLPGVVKDMGKIDFVYMDANHTYDAVLSYFEQIADYLSNNAIVVVDDIDWSCEMNKAWRLLFESEKVKVAIELNRCGILMLNRDLTKARYRIRY